MGHIPTFEKFQHNALLINDTYEILEGKISHDELSEILNEGLFSFIRGLFSNPKKKNELNKLGEELFKVKVELTKLEIEAGYSFFDVQRYKNHAWVHQM